MSFYYETMCFLKNLSKEWEMYVGEMENYVHFFPALSLVPIHVLPPSSCLKDPLFLQTECQEEHKPQTQYLGFILLPQS